MAFECSICGGNPGYTWSKTAHGAIVCEECFRKTGYRTVGMMEKMTAEEVKERIEKMRLEHPDLYGDNTSAAGKIPQRVGSYFYVNKHDKVIALQSREPGGFFGKKPEVFTFPYSEIASFKMEENGLLLISGSADGELVFNEENLATMKSEKVCESMLLSITLRDATKAQPYIELITKKIRRGAPIHREALDNGEEIMKALQNCCDSLKEA